MTAFGQGKSVPALIGARRDNHVVSDVLEPFGLLPAGDSRRSSVREAANGAAQRRDAQNLEVSYTRAVNRTLVLETNE
jgi:hypothetical protein